MLWNAATLPPCYSRKRPATVVSSCASCSGRPRQRDPGCDHAMALLWLTANLSSLKEQKARIKYDGCTTQRSTCKWRQNVIQPRRIYLPSLQTRTFNYTLVLVSTGRGNLMVKDAEESNPRCLLSQSSVWWYVEKGTKLFLQHLKTKTNKKTQSKTTPTKRTKPNPVKTHDHRPLKASFSLIFSKVLGSVAPCLILRISV